MLQNLRMAKILFFQYKYPFIPDVYINYFLMIKQSQLQASFVPHTEEVSDKCQIHRQPKLTSSKIRKKIKWVVVVITTFLLIGFLLSLYLFTKSEGRLNDSEIKLEDAQAKDDLLKSRKLIVDSDFIYQTEQDLYPFVEQITVTNPKLTFFDTTPFYNLKILNIDQNVRLDELVINNTQIVEFTYSSPEIKTVKLINNSKMTSFVKSDMPNLTYLYVYKTHITKFQNNQFGKLDKLEFVESNIKYLQLLDTKIRYLILKDCGKLETYSHSFSQYHNLETIQASDCIFLTDTYIEKLKELRSINISNSTFQNGLLVQNCLKLSELSIVSQSIAEIVLQHLPKLSTFYPKIQRIHDIWLNGTNITQFVIDTNYLQALSIVGNVTKKIQDNIPGLLFLNFKESSISELEFSKIKAPNISQLYIQKCPNLKALNNTFLFMTKLELVQAITTDFSNLNAPQLTQVFLIGGNYSEFDTRDLKSLDFLQISACNIKKLVIQNPVQYLDVSNNANQQFQLIVNSSYLKSLYLQIVNNLTIKNNNFANLTLFNIDSSKNIVVVNNTFSEQLDIFYIAYIDQFVSIENNKFSIDLQNAKRNFTIRYCPMSELKQNLSGVYSVKLSGNWLVNFDNVMQNTYNVTQLDASKNRFEQIKNVVNGFLTNLNLEQSEKLLVFSNNTFESLLVLNFYSSGQLNTFKNNTLPKLNYLSLRMCKKLLSEDILDEFRSLSQRGTDLKTLVIEDGRGNDFEAEIKSIFKNVQIQRY